MVYNEKNFNEHLPAGYDGRFHWDIFKEEGCWGDTKIQPMDFDGVVERKKHYLVFETKDEGKDIPPGQQITLSNLDESKSWTVVKLWPKEPPFSKMEISYHKGPTHIIEGHTNIIDKIRSWYRWADGGGN